MDQSMMTDARLHVVEGKCFDEERALYALRDTCVKNCIFDGPADGESALKEAAGVTLENCDLRLRYPMWHVHGGRLTDCTMTDTCRAAIWYATDLEIERSAFGGIKALRECDRVTLRGCDVHSAEFGWLCRDVALEDCAVAGEYPFFMNRRLHAAGLTLSGKYSFQYAEDCTIERSFLDTKDAFWHAKNVTVTDSTVRGEYLGWYSENLTLVRCHLIGTQPLCYCRNLTLVDCTTEGCDLSFENSSVHATIIGGVDSIKSPLSGSIVADAIGEILHDRAPVDGTACTITVR